MTRWHLFRKGKREVNDNYHYESYFRQAEGTSKEQFRDQIVHSRNFGGCSMVSKVTVNQL